MRKLLIVVLLLTSPAQARFVNDVDDFKLHCNLHQARVVALGLALRSRYYPNVDVRHLETFLRLHDAAKTTSDTSIYTIYGFEAPPLAQLYMFYGQTIPRGEKSALGDTTSRINRLDDAIAAIFFQAFGTRDAKELREIENLADLVDRGMDPVATEEFGRAMRLASTYCKDKQLRQYAEWLEQNYSEIIKGLEFPQSDDEPVAACADELTTKK